MSPYSLGFQLNAATTNKEVAIDYRGMLNKPGRLRKDRGNGGISLDKDTRFPRLVHVVDKLPDVCRVGGWLMGSGFTCARGRVALLSFVV